MKFHLHITVILLLISFESWSQTETCLQNLDDPNNHTISQIIESDTIFREYILHLPDNYDGSTPTPLILNLHGFGDCASDYSKTIGDFYNFSALANEENIIMVYPQGAYRVDKEDTYWEPGNNGIEDIYSNDVYFFEKLIEKLSNEFNLNSEMIYACGYSNGGMMAYSLACNMSSTFSAIGIMSGTMLEENCTLEKPVPIIKFHGIDDAVLPYNGSIWYQSVEEVVSFWLNQNNINSNSKITSEFNGGNVSLDEYSGENNNSCLSLYTIFEEFEKPGDHVWFSDVIEGSTPNRIMWNFFKENCAFTSSTNENSEDVYKIYPNPVKRNLTINNAINQEYIIKDINGKLVLKGSIHSDTETISLENLQSGFYIITIENHISKFLKVE